MRVCWSLLFLFATLARGFTHSFVPRNRSLPSTSSKNTTNNKRLPTHSNTPKTLLTLRGGTTMNALSTKTGEIVSLVSSSLASGPWGVVSLWAVASSVVLPLTLYRQAFSFSVGYGYSVFAMALAVLMTFKGGVDPKSSSFLLTACAAFYGFRLGTFLLSRILFSKQKRKEIKSYGSASHLKRIPFALSVSLFYAFMMTPTLYAMRFPASVGSVAEKVSYGGVVIAITGALLEAVADGHKFWVKQKYSSGGGDVFVGPTGGVYRICRHPNYLGEITFWTGLLVGGAPSFGKSVQAWICSLLGLYGIVGIMRNATSRLDDNQSEKYKGQEAYDLWVDKVQSPLVPFVS